MESIIKLKSNPHGIPGGISYLEMTDFKIEYDNHPIFQEKLSLSKKTSPVRLFTNVKLSLINLQEMVGYKYCNTCDRWVSKENNHCNICNKCTSKDGRPYKHCNLCKRCVKCSWKHCEFCKRCALKNHDCNQRPKKVENCFQSSTKGEFIIEKGK